jgi:hypothetical protein
MSSAGTCQLVGPAIHCAAVLQLMRCVSSMHVVVATVHSYSTAVQVTKRSSCAAAGWAAVLAACQVLHLLCSQGLQQH